MLNFKFMTLCFLIMLQIIQNKKNKLEVKNLTKNNIIANILAKVLSDLETKANVVIDIG